jgi:formylglycine-generating enzyme required for sulfatase activity
MTMKIKLILLFMLFQISLQANNIRIYDLTWDNITNELTFKINWDNKFNTGAFRDAAWVFVKYAPNGTHNWLHADILSCSVSSLVNEISSDQKGVMLQTVNALTTDATVTLVLVEPVGQFHDFKVMGIEMVRVAQGSFYAGDGASRIRIAPGDDENASVLITSESALTCGTSSSDIQYNIGNCFDLPAEYPKGYDDFYVMKYHITQGQYVDFLNCLSRVQQDSLVNADLSDNTIENFFVMNDNTFVTSNMGIRCDENVTNGPITFYCDANNNGIGNEADDGQFRSCNFLSLRGLLGYLDWAALRPMTFLEYEKACRGPLPPVALELSWGSSLANTPSGFINEATKDEIAIESGSLGGLLITSSVRRVGFAAVDGNTEREKANGSYYGIIDLGNNTSDQVIAQEFTEFTNDHGDGVLSTLGFTGNVLWDQMGIQDFRLKRSILIDNQKNYSVSSLGIGSGFKSNTTAGRGIRKL